MGKEYTFDHCNQGKPICARNISIFSSLSDLELANIIKLVIKREYIKGEVLCREGEVSDNLFLIRDGKIKISKVTKSGKEQILHILTKGDFFGEANLFDDKESNFTATAISNAKVGTLSKSNLEQILKMNPQISMKILKELSHKLAETEELAKFLATKDVDARIASMLLEFSNKFGKLVDGKMHIDLPLNREDMANYCGITRETISRKLSKFENENIIELKGNKVVIIKDMDLIKDLSE